MDSHIEICREASKRWRKAHPKERKIMEQKYHNKIRLEVLIHYGGNPPKCACCGESRYEFLTIDHINKCGKEKRKLQGHGYRFLQWIRRNHFPKGFRVLCYNCNCSLGHHGYCPHDKEFGRK